MRSPVLLTLTLAIGLGCAHQSGPPLSSAARVFDQALQAATSPAGARRLLEQGNARFLAGTPLRRDHAGALAATSTGQYPFAAILSCIDSRVPPELVFDQGIGDLFVGRVAGNIVNDDLLASFEYATKVVGTPLLVVLGHSSCGAIKAACEGIELGHITGLLDQIEPAIAAIGRASDHPGKDPLFLADVTAANVRLAVAALSARSPILADLVTAGKLEIVGAVYDVATGQVQWLESSE